MFFLHARMLRRYGKPIVELDLADVFGASCFRAPLESEPCRKYGYDNKDGS
jgi:hypothetical protein